MHRRKSAGRPMPLSEEYIHDSSDQETETETTINSIPEAQKVDHTTTKESWKKPQKSTIVTQRSLKKPCESSENSEDKDGTTNMRHKPATKETVKPIDFQKPPRKRAETKPMEPASIPAEPYEPPQGFVRLTTSASEYASPASELLSSNLAGKQVWHITAPSSLPFECIKSFSIDAVRSGKPVVTHERVSYGLSSGSSASETLLLLDSAVSDYITSNARITRTFHLQETFKDLTTRKRPGSETLTATTFVAHDKPPSKKPRQQPQELHMRYKAFGASGERHDVSEDYRDLDLSSIDVLPDGPTPALELKAKQKRRARCQRALGEAVSQDLVNIVGGEDYVSSSKDSSKAVEASEYSIAQDARVDGEVERKERKRKKKKKRMEANA